MNNSTTSITSANIHDGTAPSRTTIDQVMRIFATGNHAEALSVLNQNVEEPACYERLREFLVAERKQAELAKLLSTPRNNTRLDGLALMIDAHLKRDYERAITLGQNLLREWPGDCYVLNHLARSLFNVGKKNEALAFFQQAVTKSPDYPEAWNGLGHVLRDRGQLPEAQEAFQRALATMPTFPTALLNLGIVLMAQARPAEAKTQFQHLLDVDPQNADGWLNLASVLHLLRQHDGARDAYITAIARSQNRTTTLLAHRQLAKLYNETAGTDLAISHFKIAISLDNQNPELHAELASVYELANRIEEGWEFLSESLRKFPHHPLINFEAAKLERRLGRHKEGLSRLHRISPDDIPPHIRQWYFHELGTALDRAGEADDAYKAFVSSNELARKGARAQITDRQAFDRALHAMADWISICAPVPAYDSDEDLGTDLCFLMGFPRSGTTLLDVMLDGHPRVISLEERQTMEIIFHEVDSKLGGFPHGLSNADKQQRQALRQHYRSLLAKYIDGPSNGMLIIDKMPIRTPYALFMSRLFPAAKFLFSVRHPCDVVLSNFMQHYAANEVFVHFYSLLESAETYSKVMQLWVQSLPHMNQQQIHYVRYESLIENTSGTLADVCSFLGLPWQDDLTQHQKTLSERDRIRTNSYHQVAEPIYRRAAGRWHAYRAHFTEALPLLQSHVKFFGYSME